MNKSYNTKPQEPLSYYPLPDGMVDVYLRKPLENEVDAEGNLSYVYDEVYFKISAEVARETISENFNLLFEDAHALDNAEPTLEDRVATTENKVATIEQTIDVIFGGV